MLRNRFVSALVDWTSAAQTETACLFYVNHSIDIMGLGPAQPSHAQRRFVLSLDASRNPLKYSK